MQRQAALAYQQTARQTVSPTELEASILSKSAGNFQRIKDNWDELKGDLSAALTYNRKLWVVFVESVSRDDSPLPQAIRQNIANLGLFVMKHTMDVQMEPAPAKLDVLININREIAAGLRTNQSAG